MKTVATHNGDFHLDDIFAVATLELFLKEECKIIRTRDVEKINSADFVVDVGRVYDPAQKRFDHHQEGGAGARENTIPYASLGLVWKAFGNEICNSEIISLMVDESLVQPIDALDNGIQIATSTIENMNVPLIHSIAGVFRPTWKEEDTTDEYFRMLVMLPKKYLERLIVVTRDRLEAEEFVREAYEKALDKRIILLEHDYPYGDVLSRFNEPLFVVYPHEKVDQSWRIKALRKIDGNSVFECKAYLPVAWGGKEGEELEKISEVPGALFVHNGLFTGAASTKEGALLMAHKAVEEHEKNGSVGK